MKSPVLVTGGAGYIGSHIVAGLREAGQDVVVYDDLRLGHKESVPEDVPWVRGSLDEEAKLVETIDRYRPRRLIHMAANSQVGESMQDPAGYYRNNVIGSIKLFDAARSHGIESIVFSSTAAVYGDPHKVPIGEDHPLQPGNPYGDTKLAIERALHWFGKAYGVRSVCLRYFNAAGADPNGSIGEDHTPETHLIPRLILDVLSGGASKTSIFGTDYPTADGTCVRDYIHVCDLADAHVKALSALEADTLDCPALNLGNGEGFSVRQVIDTVAAVSGHEVATEEADRRPGDPAVLIAASDRARERLGWVPRFPTLEAIVETAWRWHRDHPRGYDAAMHERVED